MFLQLYHKHYHMKICIHSLTQLNYTMIFNLFLFMQSLQLKTRKIGQSFCFPSLEDQCSLCGQHFTTMKHMEEQKLHKLRGTYSHVCRVKIGSCYISDSVFLSEEEQRHHLNENARLGQNSYAHALQEMHKVKPKCRVNFFEARV